jgi:hypothetical protein
MSAISKLKMLRVQGQPELHSETVTKRKKGEEKRKKRGGEGERKERKEIFKSSLFWELKY